MTMPRALLEFGDPSHPDQPPVRLAFGEPQQVLVAHTLDQVRPVLEQVDACSRQGLWCVGYVRYEAAPAFDAALQVHAAEGPLAWFGVHAQPLADTEVPDPSGPEPHVPWTLRTGRAEFDDKVARIHAAIARGDLYQLNYTAQLEAPFASPGADSLWAYFAALRRSQPKAYAACIDTGDEQVLSVSPELFFDWDGQHIVSRPMKGTAPRGANPQDDAAQAERLRSTPKEQAENVMIVDLIRNDLSRVAQAFSVRVPRLFHLEALPTVWQMTSDVVATTRAGTRLWDVFAALFPCGSVTGAPKVQAMRQIKALEPQARGVYCGAVGLVRPGGHATFNVPIRTVTVRGAQAHCGIGSGITMDAQADSEWQEWQHKRMFLERASQPFALLETLALREGVFHHQTWHVQRMAQAAAHFGYRWDTGQVGHTLAAVAHAHPSGAWRVRLLLQPSGQCSAEAFALADTPAPVRLQLANRPLVEAHSEFVRFKTTRRAHYDAFTPADPAVFDTVLFNPQGEVTECTRGNIAMQIDGRWVTPPLSCGLLPGIGRARLLAQGRVVEQRVPVDALARVQAWAFVNSLRGWLDAELRA